MLEEPYLFCQKTGGLPTEFLKIAVGAFAADQQLPAQVQAGKTHVAGGVGNSIPADDPIAALLGDVELAPKADISPTEDYGKFCRNCKHFISHPFKSICTRNNLEADPMSSCSYFSFPVKEK